MRLGDTCQGRFAATRKHQRLSQHETLTVLHPASLEPPCADRRGELPDGCPGWCEFSDPDPRVLAPSLKKTLPGFGVGSRLPGGIRLERELGQGGMGTVFQGWDALSRRRVAVKVLGSQYLEDVSIRGRFLTEARALARIESPFVVGVRRFGQHHGIPFIVMDHVLGTNLADQLDGPMPVDRALEILDAVARGLAAVHHAGIVHNDVKPGNVMVGPSGAITLIDFGIARPYASVCRSRPGVFSGTPAYMAPELVGGGSESPSPAADLYALGCLAFELLAGTVPFNHDDTSVVFSMHALHDAPSLSEHARVPQQLDELIAWCLEKEPYHRVPSASVFARRIGELRRALGSVHLGFDRA